MAIFLTLYRTKPRALETNHTITFNDARQLTGVSDQSVELVVTSPPYPMIEMWDDSFGRQNSEITNALEKNDGNAAFELMHQELDKVWQELYRVLKPGGIACINIGDATRTFNGDFRLYTNHARIINAFLKVGFNNLPNILWRKQTNAPNKFMGSGTLPPGAYVTLEHEHVLIFRKGNKRIFKSDSEKLNRQRSAFFWEERNQWFSDLWNLKGTRQQLLNGKTRERSGAFPFELAYRLINMFSVKEDTVLDPFLGAGTTTFSAIAAGRNSLGIELDPQFSNYIFSIENDFEDRLNDRIQKRLNDHLNFVKEREAEKGKQAFKHTNKHYGFPVMSSQEKELVLNFINTVDLNQKASLFKVNYIEEPILEKFHKKSLFADSF